MLFLAHEDESTRWPKEMRAQLKTMQRDVQSLSDHTTYLTNSITFLLDAMLGLVSIEQNNIIKLFSVVAVVLMPPTLVGTVYGMNFKHMPELKWALGYPIALLRDGRVGDPAVPVFQVEEVVVSDSSVEHDVFPKPLHTFRLMSCAHTCWPPLM